MLNTFNITLSHNALQLVVSALAKLPYEVSVDAINDISTQANAQLEPLMKASQPVKEETDSQ